MAVQNTDEVVKLIWNAANAHEAMALRESIRIYRDDWEDIVQNKLEEMFTDPASRARLKPLISTEINLCKKVVNERAMVYRGPAQRVALVGENPDERYTDIISNSRLDTVMLAANRYTTLVNHCLIRPLFRKGRLEYDLILPDQFELYTSEDDWKEVVAVKYYINSGSDASSPFAYAAGNTRLDRKAGWVWVKKNAIISFDGSVLSLDAGVYRFDNGKNLVKAYDFPYQVNGENVLPFVLTYKEYPIETLLNFTQDSALPESALEIAVLLTYVNELIKYQSFVQLVITGDTDLTLPNPMRSGPGTIHKLLSQGGTANMSAVNVTGPIREVTDTILQRAQWIAAQYGIPPSAFTLTGTPQSGYAMKMDRSALEEQRKLELPNWRDFEHQLFEITRVVNNTDAASFGVIPEEAVFKIDFAEPVYANNPQEEVVMWQSRIANNVATPVDWIKAENPDLDQEQAEILHLKNKAINNPNGNMAPLSLSPAPVEEDETEDENGEDEV